MVPSWVRHHADGQCPPQAGVVVDWDIGVGDTDTRTSIQARHRGSPSRGISAPARGSGLRNIMLWWRPDRGGAFGYQDGWTPSGEAFYFSGLGQEGDQGFSTPYQENGRLRDHAVSGDQVRLLKYVAANTVRYVGELRLDPVDPWRWRDGHDRTGAVRKIIQFRLLPVGRVKREPSDPVHEPPSSRPVAVRHIVESLPEPRATHIEALKSVTFRQGIAARQILARRRELELVHALRDWLDDQLGLTATGLLIPYAPESRNLRVDLFVSQPPLLIEAKSSASRESIRLAIGQLLDYQRWVAPQPELAMLVPTEPAEDMLELLQALGIGAIWPSGRSFVFQPPGLL